MTRLLDELRCPACGGRLRIDNKPTCVAISLECGLCGQDYAIIDNIPRMLLPSMREAMEAKPRSVCVESKKASTARSFGYEWARFSEMHPEYERNFLEYQAPHGPEFFGGKKVLDAGCGSGRHAYYAGRFGAEVWAVDLSPAVEVARRNTEKLGNVYVVQADLFHLPFEPESFDYVYSTGVLHHLPDPESGFRSLLRQIKPGGELRVYLYWTPEGQPVKRLMVIVAGAVRAVTTRLPYSVVHAIAYPAAAIATFAFVWPYKLLRRVPGLRRLAERMPMKQYANYPFRVCVNDQFDRLSAPLENRYTRAEVEAWFRRAGLERIEIRPNFGWVGSGVRPVSAGAGTS